MFNKQKVKIAKDSAKQKNIDATLYQKPLVCLFDVDEHTTRAAETAGFNISVASLGKPVLTSDISRQNQNLFLLNHSWPENIHEYDVFVVDMARGDAVSYKKDEHNIVYQTNEKAHYISVEYPQTIFDGRAYSGNFLHRELNNIVDRRHILITFASRQQNLSYKIVTIPQTYGSDIDRLFDNYSFMGSAYHSKNLVGKEVEVCVSNKDLMNILETCKNLIRYEGTFYHPTRYENNQDKERTNFIPLMVNKNKEIVSYVEFDSNCTKFVFPQMTDKEKLLVPLLETVLPSIHPEIFPESTLFSWKKDQAYWLPNHSELLKKRSDIEYEYKCKMDGAIREIDNNLDKHSFLHDLLSQTDDALVQAVLSYFRWLGYSSAVDMDNGQALKEEDIQVELDNGLLIVECKGIGGTSKDSDCNQINKIKHRRCKERNKFDVFALYIVNHQRYLPPKQRKNPPFSEQQIADAQTEERGLLTTWELFKAYFMEQKGIIDKDYKRRMLL